MRKPMRIEDQIQALRLYLRTVRAAMNAAYRDSEAGYRKRKICPFVESLRYRRSRFGFELHDIAEECMRELRHVQALRRAEFAPGQQISYQVHMPGYERRPERAVIVDAEWSRPNSYHYVIWHVTKQGDLFKRGESWLSASKHIQIERCELALRDEARQASEGFKRTAAELVSRVVERGDLSLIAEVVQKRRARSGLA